MGVCERCTENGNCAWQNHDETICREKPAFPTTNADRIRAMSVEEMAAEMTAKGGCPHYCDTPDDMDTDCVQCWLDWLKQEGDNGQTP